MKMARGRTKGEIYNMYQCVWLLILLSCSWSCSAFQSDELIIDDEEFGLEGGRTVSPDLDYINPSLSSTPTPTTSSKNNNKRSSFSSDNIVDSDSRIQFSLEHAFGSDSDFSHAGTFTARLKASIHGGQTLTKLRFSRESFTDSDKQKFQKLLQDDDFYKIRLPSNVLSPPGKDYIISSVRARCLPRDSLDEHFVIHMDGVNIIGVNYGSPGACEYPRPLRFPRKWTFNSHTVLKSSEQAPRAPAFTEDILGVENGEDGIMMPPPERSFWAKYWMYMIPLGLIVMNAVTQAMNMPEEQAAGQSTARTQQPTAQRAANAAVRRR